MFQQVASLQNKFCEGRVIAVDATSKIDSLFSRHSRRGREAQKPRPRAEIVQLAGGATLDSCQARDMLQKEEHQGGEDLNCQDRKRLGGVFRRPINPLEIRT